METSKQYGWVRFYTELADKLLEYRSDRPALLQKLQTAFNNVVIDNVRLSLSTWPDEDSFTDIDPFTVFNSFNQGFGDDKRRKVVNSIAKEFSITPMENDENFDGIPRNPRIIWFYPKKDKRKPDDIDKLWALFDSALAYSNNASESLKQVFISKFDAVKTIDRISWNITFALFWVRPYFYISLDQKNREFLISHKILSGDCLKNIAAGVPPSGESYLQICQELRSRINNQDLGYKTFPSLSYAAYLESQQSGNHSNDLISIIQNKDNIMPTQTHEELVESLKELLLSKKQIVLTGAPGTGKTYLAKEIAASMLGKTPKAMIADAKAGTEKRYQFRQFHPGYDYSDFVEGLKPHLEGGKPTFVPTAGIFMQFCIDAAADSPEQPYVMVIDEINRADLSRVFGELFYGLEKDYRGQPIPTQYSYLDNRPYIEKGKQFEIPPNVYIIGTMNDIDRSVESMDFALRRRFAWQEITIEDSESIITNNVPEEISASVIRVMHAINSNIINSMLGLDRAYFLGGAYFKEMKDATPEAWEQLWKYNVKVILTEYLRASRKSLKIEALEEAFRGIISQSGDEA